MIISAPLLKQYNLNITLCDLKMFFWQVLYRIVCSFLYCLQTIRYFLVDCFLRRAYFFGKIDSSNVHVISFLV